MKVKTTFNYWKFKQHLILLVQIILYMKKVKYLKYLEQG